MLALLQYERKIAVAMDCQKINDCTIKLLRVDDSDSNLGTATRHVSHSSLTWSAFYGRWNLTGKMRCRIRINGNEVFSIEYYVRYSYDDALSSYHFRRDEDCIAWFAWQFNDLAHRMKNIVSANVPKETLSKEQCETYRSATRCHIC